jgi:hypothetical protein
VPLVGNHGARHNFSVLDEEVERIVMTILADIREDVSRIRRELVEDNGEEEEEDLG